MRVELDIQNNNVIKGEKYYYGNQFPTEFDDVLLRFDYDENGQLTQIKDEKENYGYIWPIKPQTFLEDPRFALISQNTYYNNLYPLIPGGSV
jgi:hypothetical protein